MGQDISNKEMLTMVNMMVKMSSEKELIDKLIKKLEEYKTTKGKPPLLELQMVMFKLVGDKLNIQDLIDKNS